MNLVILGSALVVIVIFGMVALLMLNQKAERKKRMMSVVQGSAVQTDDKSKKGSAQDQRRHDLAKKLKEAEKEDEKRKENKPGLSEMIMHAGLEISVKQFWVYSFVFCIIATLLVYLSGQSNLVVLMTAITSFLGLPKMFLKMKAAKRQKKFLDDFADALESMTRLLKAGMPVSEAIKMVSREYGGPVGEEMGRIFDQQKIGIPLPEAVLNGAKRMPLTEVQMFATAIAIQTQTGSSLSEVLENLAGVIRARYALKRKVKALSAEAKASAGIIAALPCFVAGALWLINRPYIMLLFNTSIGNVLLGGALFWMFIGVVVMRQMINFKV